MLESSLETSFYPDESQSTCPSYAKMRNLRKTMTLDLDSGVASPAKRARFNGLLNSPDLNMLKLGSPELESLLIQQHGHVTTTPTPGQYLNPTNNYPKSVTEEQEMYARGFVEALAELHHYNGDPINVHQNLIQPSSPSNSSSTNDDITLINYHSQQQQQHPHPQSQQLHHSHHQQHQQQQQQYTSNDHYSDYILPMAIKEEPQTVPSGSSGCSRDTPPLSPIDMMAQERIKLERKRQRNRLAASKCRKRKLERIARLEDKVKLLKDDNTELGVVVSRLKDNICRLKEQLMEHVNSGCQVMSLPNEYAVI